MAGVKPLLETIGALLPKGIKAWHASPHDFDKVDLSKIGTGQGAASYGPGFYAAEHPDVSGPGGTYWREFVTRFSDPEVNAADILKRNGFDRAAAAEEARKTLQQERGELASGVWSHNNKPIDAVSMANTQSLIAMREKALKLLEGSGPVGPRVYELNLKADPRSFLQWDEPLKGQPKALQEIYSGSVSYPRPTDKGEEIYRSLSRTGGSIGSAYNDRLGMDTLRDAGIPGIRYLDQASRSLGPANDPAAQKQLADVTNAVERLRSLGDNLKASELDQTRARLQRGLDTPRTYNYVVNNPEIIEIMRKLAIPGMVGGAASVYQPQGQQ